MAKLLHDEGDTGDCWVCTFVMRLLSLSMLAMIVASCAAPTEFGRRSSSTITHDGVSIFGDLHAGDLDRSAPLVLLFHQGGSSGRGEYAEIVPWLNGAGFRAMTWDLRAGGDLHGVANRTVDALAEGVPADYCDAYADLEAALDHVIAAGLAERVVLWGSSYSGALVFRLAAEHPEQTLGVIAFSPASGGPVASCRAALWLANVHAPALALRPASEMQRETSLEQRAALTAGGVEFAVIANGVHGSSMLLDSRTQADMSEARERVLTWLDDVTP